jgi:hypothetical protein
MVIVAKRMYMSLFKNFFWQRVMKICRYSVEEARGSNEDS